eukprot:2806206-Amphidinium_carterae.2
MLQLRISNCSGAPHVKIESILSALTRIGGHMKLIAKREVDFQPCKEYHPTGDELGTWPAWPLRCAIVFALDLTSRYFVLARPSA